MTIRWSHTAQSDLDQIYEFMVEDNPGAATRVQDRLLVAGKSLNNFAGRGRPGRISGTRELVVMQTPYLLIYTEEDGATVVLRVMHGAQLWPPEGSS